MWGGRGGGRGVKYRKQRALCQRAHPILIPQQIQQLLIKATLEMLNHQRIILATMRAKILNLTQRDCLILRVLGVLALVTRGIRPERTNIHLARGDGAVRINHDGEEGVEELLLGHLRVDVDAGEPAAVPRVRVVPSEDVVGASEGHLEGVVVGHVAVGGLLGVYPGFGAFDGEGVGVHDDEGVVGDFALLK